MKLLFTKYQGTGNDFVILDNRKGQYSDLTQPQIELVCDRKFGVGADGLMLLNAHVDFDFEMVYFNSDGNESSMCGNGGRCIAHFAHVLIPSKNAFDFIAIDGPHKAVVKGSNVDLQMMDVDSIEVGSDFHWLDTGSPHYVKVVGDLANLDLIEDARAIRYSDRFAAEGTNVNFMKEENGVLHVRTYERGVEDETLSCGTGVTACAMVYSLKNNATEIPLKVEGGELNVKFNKTGNAFNDVWLCGPATRVFEGEITID